MTSDGPPPVGGRDARFAGRAAGCDHRAAGDAFVMQVRDDQVPAGPQPLCRPAKTHVAPDRSGVNPLLQRKAILTCQMTHSQASDRVDGSPPTWPPIIAFRVRARLAALRRPG
jgi:hypothetical protein